ncbi:hypothetical protein NUU61_001055 [Penicillium alfredii]|uniref:AT hook motif protein n=1 Tax=Penicillium alfredii TaxID=1506179 RepID=A0A9W9GAW9_9EURO|nr:uncharacterized protein NUU61_001055 [Penicillium alfredii]KAJ5115296.1 hypothetical protein NUU61_001055 [Penicillium alfredii]
MTKDTAPVSPKMSQVWDRTADAKLLAAIIETNPNPIDFNAVAAYMGDGRTPNALRHRVIRIKESAKGGDMDSTPKGPPAATPAKRKRGTATKVTKPKGKANSKANSKTTQAQAGATSTIDNNDTAMAEGLAQDEDEVSNMKLKTETSDNEYVPPTAEDNSTD